MDADGAPATADDMMRAEAVIGQIFADLEIDYAVREGEMTAEEANSNFANRAALLRVRAILVDRAEQLAAAPR